MLLKPSSPNLVPLVKKIDNATPENSMILRKCMTLKQFTKINHLFHINASSLNENFDNLQHLLNFTQNVFDIIAVSETRIEKQVSLLNNLNLNNYSF